MGIKTTFNNLLTTRASSPGKDVSVGTETTIKPARVLELIAEIREASEAHAGVVTSQGSADTEANGLLEEIGLLRRSIAAKEASLAVSGEPLPEDAFPEEAQISRLERQLRVVKARERILAESAEAGKTKISDLRNALREAWREFALATCKEQRARFRRAGLLLRSLYAEQMACLTAFGPIGLIYQDIAIVGDPENPAQPLVDSRSLMVDVHWKKLAGERYQEISALRDRVDGASRG